MLLDNTNRAIWGIPRQIADKLEFQEKPVLNAWDLFAQMRRAHHDSGKAVPPPRDLYRIAYVLIKAGIIRPDLDYSQHYRVAEVSDRSADDIVCLIDRFCHISYLSAMHRWSLTDGNHIH